MLMPRYREDGVVELVEFPELRWELAEHRAARVWRKMRKHMAFPMRKDAKPHLMRRTTCTLDYRVWGVYSNNDLARQGCPPVHTAISPAEAWLKIADPNLEWSRI